MTNPPNILTMPHGCNIIKRHSLARKIVAHIANRHDGTVDYSKHLEKKGSLRVDFYDQSDKIMGVRIKFHAKGHWIERVAVWKAYIPALTCAAVIELVDNHLRQVQLEADDEAVQPVGL